MGIRGVAALKLLKLNVTGDGERALPEAINGSGDSAVLGLSADTGPGALGETDGGNGETGVPAG
jgi:hypothetical protein